MFFLGSHATVAARILLPKIFQLLEICRSIGDQTHMSSLSGNLLLRKIWSNRSGVIRMGIRISPTLNFLQECARRVPVQYLVVVQGCSVLAIIKAKTKGGRVNHS
uniref:Uncharacterized protein n=1 Tax=Coccidioides posadasii RMSCC 3488 TaxID=454284 RepID=A0A0J6F507_COCPO|nr:hypothetical protein CPAG_00406 [Coccidioides posadasii RMSCC 3488]